MICWAMAWCWWREIWKTASIYSIPTSTLPGWHQLELAMLYVSPKKKKKHGKTCMENNHLTGVVICNFRNSLLVLKWQQTVTARFSEHVNGAQSCVRHGGHLFSFFCWLYLNVERRRVRPGETEAPRVQLGCDSWTQTNFFGIFVFSVLLVRNETLQYDNN